MVNREKLKNPDIMYRPDVRWWLAEGFHTDETLKNDISLLHDSGFGAVEFLAMEEPGADSKLYGWGAEEWVHDSQVIVEETTKKSMGVSMTSGTNWSNANLITITPDDKAAAKELDYAVEILSAGSSRTGKVLESEIKMPNVLKQDLVAVVAIKSLGNKEGKEYLDKDSAVILTHQVTDGTLSWKAPDDGDYRLFYFWIHGTGQTAAPSVSTSYTINYIDHYGMDAFVEYWDNTVLTPALRKSISENGRAMMYMDSLELATFGKGGQFWGYHFNEEFERRRGYDLTPYLPFIIKEAGMFQQTFQYHYYMEDGAFAEKLYNDLYQTMTDMYMDNLLKPMQEWLHSVGMTLRAEISYGLPFEISQPGKYVDGIETESLEFASQIEPYRNLSGPAHIYNRTYSSETGATTLNYMMGMDFYTQIIYTQFAAGITKTVLHGYSSIAGSEDSTYWPGHEGMWPIFSERFGVRQPAFRHYNDWTDMVARYQMLLSQGKPRMDLGILRLDYYFNNMYMGEDERDLYEHQLMRGDEGVYWKDMKLQHAGYTWDYFAPQILEEDFVNYAGGSLIPEGPGYQALLIYQETLPVKTAEKLLELAKKGLVILFVNGVNETIRPGGLHKTHDKAANMTPFNDGADGKLKELVAEMKKLPNVKEIDDQSQTYETLQSMGIKPRTEFSEPNKNILTLVREDGDTTYFYAYNMLYTEEESFSFQAAVAGEGKPYRVDCWNAEVEEVGCYGIRDGSTVLDITLAPGEACLYAIDCAAKDLIHVVRTDVQKPDNKNRVLQHKGKFTALVCESGQYSVKFNDGSELSFHAEVPDDIIIDNWNLEVEDWNEGDKKVITEDRGLGIVTNEVYYETKKTVIHAGTTDLKPWKDIQAVGPAVSGVGYYEAKVSLPESWSEEHGAILKIGSTNGNTAAVYVNGAKARAVDFDALAVDISELLRPGENTVLVEVSTTLNNRLLARGYFDKVTEMSLMLSDHANNAFEGGEEKENSGPSFDISASVQDYGMVGEVKLMTYTKVNLI